MNIGIIGAGFTGLSAAQTLASLGHLVTVIEDQPVSGGFASGFREKTWKWSLDKYYHHLFTSDHSILNLAKKVRHKILFIRPITSTFVKGVSYRLDSPISLLRFPLLPIIDRIRTGITLAFLHINPNCHILEKTTSYKFINRYAGKKSWKIIWKPLFVGKFGKFTKKISAVWFWARIKKRSQALGYPKGGFTALVNSIQKNIDSNNGKIIHNTKILRIFKNNKILYVKTNKGLYSFDKVICTLPTPVFLKVTADLPTKYIRDVSQLKNLSSITMILKLKSKFLSDNTYWLNINEPNYPFIALVEHTNFIDKKMYGNQTLLYVGNYLENDDRYLKYTKNALIKEFVPFLKKIHQNFKKEDIIKSWVFKARFAQPIVDLKYKDRIPSHKTPIENLYLANMQQVYPWDRGTNYAVELGQKIAYIIHHNKL